MSDGPDQVIARVRDTLRMAPETVPDPRAMARVLSAVWESPTPSALRRLFDAWRVPAFSGLAAAAVAGFALLGGFFARGVIAEHGSAEPLTATGTRTGEFAVPAAAVAGDAAPVPTQFVFDEATAASVSVVGDFNEWKAGANPLVRLEHGLWTTSVALPPGRHVYAFLVDGTLVVADPRAPKVGDADYGREGSVVMVFAR